jgi:hypothetical protein
LSRTGTPPPTRPPKRCFRIDASRRLSMTRCSSPWTLRTLR